MVKHEMLRMLCNDAVNHPTADQAGKKGKASIASLRGELEANPLSKIADEEMQEVVMIGWGAVGLYACVLESVSLYS